MVFATAVPWSAAQETLVQRPATASPDGTVARQLKLGTVISREPVNQSQAYEIYLRASDFLDLLIRKGDLHIFVAVFSSGGELLGKFPSTRYEPLRVALVGEQAGVYRLEVRSLETSAANGFYDLKVETQRSATAQDRKTVAAVRACAAASGLRAEWKEQALREAISKYKEALKLWRAVNQNTEATKTLESIGEIHFSLGENRQALSYYRQAFKAARISHDPLDETRELNKVGYVQSYLGMSNLALAYSTRALAYYSRPRAKRLDDEDRRAEAEARNSAGEAHYALGNPRKSIDSFNDALSQWHAAQDRSGEALASLNLGYAYSDLGDLERAQKHLNEALSICQKIGERRGEAQALTALGTIHAFWGEKQVALDRHAQAMNIFRTLGDHEGQAVALNSIGQAYEDLNEPQTAMDNYHRALQIFAERSHRDFEAVTRYYLGRVYNSLGNKEKALEYFEQSRLQGRQSGQQRVTAYALAAISALRSAEGHRQEALGQLTQVLRLYRSLADRHGQLDTLNNIGHIYDSLGETRTALQYYQQALLLSRAAGDRMAEAATLYNIAHAEVTTGALRDALLNIENSLSAIESLRSQIVSPELRASYFASVHQHFELYIDLLMRLDKLQPDQGFAATALQASENSRARALYEILSEASAHIRQGVEPSLLEQERSLQRSLSAKATYQLRLLDRTADSEQIAEADRELRDLNTAYQQVETQIKQRSPRYATLVQPAPLRLSDIQAEINDPDTLLLEYSLGEEHSYVWALTANSLTSYQLPARSQIEAPARALYQLLTVRQTLNESEAADYQQRIAAADGQYWKRAADLSQTLLGPVAAALGKKRLLIVADGPLQYLPFEALPTPMLAAGRFEDATEGVPLMLDHEIISLPSASTLAVIRRGGQLSPADARLVAILADPVFTRNDPRVHASSETTAQAQPTTEESPAVLANENSAPAELTNIPRLPATREEAEAIMAVTPGGDGMMATDFEASRALAMSGQLGRYRIVHFATHGFINIDHPELSGIMLSQLSREGRGQAGFLQIHDVYNLELSGTQLVVLSACRTGLGKEIKGEGLVGLTRGFMYAGSTSVVASLWKVDDHATAELMKHFYQGMFAEKLTPAAALRQAKEKMWRQERYRPPFFWAAFVLQGEYRDAIAIPRPHRIKTYILIAIALLSILTVGLYCLRRLRRNRLARS